jgi:hypothetical protein
MADFWGSGPGSPFSPPSSPTKLVRVFLTGAFCLVGVGDAGRERQNSAGESSRLVCTGCRKESLVCRYCVGPGLSTDVERFPRFHIASASCPPAGLSPETRKPRTDAIWGSAFTASVAVDAANGAVCPIAIPKRHSGMPTHHLALVSDVAVRSCLFQMSQN